MKSIKIGRRLNPEEQAVLKEAEHLFDAILAGLQKGLNEGVIYIGNKEPIETLSKEESEAFLKSVKEDFLKSKDFILNKRHKNPASTMNEMSGFLSDYLFYPSWLSGKKIFAQDGDYLLFNRLFDLEHKNNPASGRNTHSLGLDSFLASRFDQDTVSKIYAQFDSMAKSIDAMNKKNAILSVGKLSISELGSKHTLKQNRTLNVEEKAVVNELKEVFEATLAIYEDLAKQGQLDSVIKNMSKEDYEVFFKEIRNKFKKDFNEINNKLYRDANHAKRWIEGFSETYINEWAKQSRSFREKIGYSGAFRPFNFEYVMHKYKPSSDLYFVGVNEILFKHAAVLKDKLEKFTKKIDALNDRNSLLYPCREFFREMIAKLGQLLENIKQARANLHEAINRKLDS